MHFFCLIIPGTSKSVHCVIVSLSRPDLPDYRVNHLLHSYQATDFADPRHSYGMPKSRPFIKDNLDGISTLFHLMYGHKVFAYTMIAEIKCFYLHF